MAGGWSVGIGLSNPQTYGANTSTSSTTTITTGSSANTKGSWTQLVSSTNYDASWALLFVDLRNPSTSNVTYDFAVGPSGSESIFLNNLYCNWVDSTIPHLLLPISIPAGSRIAVRAQSNNASDTVGAACILFDSNFNDQGSGNGVDTYGWNALSNDYGMPITSGAGNGTFGSFDEITSSTTYDYRGVFIAMDSQSATADGVTGYPTTLLDIAVGPVGSEQVVIPGINVGWFSNSGSQCGGNPGFTQMVPCAIPAGSRISARLAASNSSPLSIGATFYGVR